MLNFWTGYRKAIFSDLGFYSALCGAFVSIGGVILAADGYGWVAWAILAIATVFLPAFGDGMDYGSVIPRDISTRSGLAAAYTVSVTAFVIGMYIVLPMFQLKADSAIESLPLLER